MAFQASGGGHMSPSGDTSRCRARLNYQQSCDLEDDPREMTNLYESPSQQKRVAELKKRLTGLRTKYADDTGKDW